MFDILYFTYLNKTENHWEKHTERDASRTEWGIITNNGS